MKIPGRYSNRQTVILAGSFLLLVGLIGSAVGFLVYDFYGHPAASITTTFVPTPFGTGVLYNSTIPPTVIPTTSTNATFTLTQQAGQPASTTTPVIYIVQTNDTLWNIALKFGTSVDAIKKANGLTNDIIYLGHSLTIPSGDNPTPTMAGTVHIVAEQDTIDTIAAQYGISADDLRAANYMAGDALLPGQTIVIPQTMPVVLAPYRFTINQGDLVSSYPLSLTMDRFTLHYAPNTFPAQDPKAVADMVQRSVNHIESLFQIQLPGTFDVYAVGSLFEHPESQLRGISFSGYHRYFFIHDGSGSAVDQQYISAHELTHLFLWDSFGQPASTMLSEGVAVYSGMRLIAGSDYIPLNTFCSAYWQAGHLPVISEPLSFTGHIYDLENYYASGSFVGYLIETYGIQLFRQLYPSADFVTVYGKTLPSLEQDWIVSLNNVQLPVGLDPTRLVGSVNTLETSYSNFMPTFSGTAAQRKAYYHLDLARLALLKGNLDEMQSQLTEFQSALAGK